VQSQGRFQAVIDLLHGPRREMPDRLDDQPLVDGEEIGARDHRLVTQPRLWLDRGIDFHFGRVARKVREISTRTVSAIRPL